METKLKISNSIICLKLNTNFFTLTYLAEIIFPNNYMTQHCNDQFWLIPISTRKHDTIFDEYNFSPCHQVTLSISSFHAHLIRGILIYL